MSVSVTPAAAAHIIKHLGHRKAGLGIRVGVRTTGCSGLAYTLEFVDVIMDSDEVFEADGVKVFVSKQDVAYINGLSLDYEKQGLNEGFSFKNPNEKSRCGCGESFSI
jgi:iron-sulfur cluster assembly protein